MADVPLNLEKLAKSMIIGGHRVSSKVNREMIKGDLGEALGAIGRTYGFAALGASAVSGYLARKPSKAFAAKWKQVPQEDKDFIQYLRDKEARDESIAKRTKWVRKAPLALSVGAGAWQYGKLHRSRKDRILAMINHVKATRRIR